MGKIIKHEFKDTWLEITIICGAFIAMATISALVLKYIRFYYFSSLLIIAMVILYIVALAVVLINIIKSFNNRIFGNEGYLTLTLPISIDKILLGKIIVNFIWMITVAGTLIIGLGIMFIIIENLNPGDISYMLRDVFDNFGNFILSIAVILIQALFALVLLVFVLSVLNIGRIKKFKFLVGIVLYYIISTIIGWLGNLLLIFPYRAKIRNGELLFERFTLRNSDIFYDPLMGYINLNLMFWCLVGIFGFYFLTRHFIKNLLELE